MTASPVVGIMAVFAAWVLFWMAWPTIGRTLSSTRARRPHTPGERDGGVRRAVGHPTAAGRSHRRPDLHALIPTSLEPHEGGRAADPKSAPTGTTARPVGDVLGSAAPTVHSP